MAGIGGRNRRREREPDFKPEVDVRRREHERDERADDDAANGKFANVRNGRNRSRHPGLLLWKSRSPSKAMDKPRFAAAYSQGTLRPKALVEATP